MTTQEIINELERIKSKVEKDSYTVENLNALIEKLTGYKGTAN